jgi:hypothetical protein
MANLDEESATLVRDHLARMNELNSPGRQFVQELDPKIAGIVKKLQQNPSFILKVDQFLESLTIVELKPIDKTQTMG